MKKVFKSLVITCVLFICLIITACSTKEFNVTFNYNNGSDNVVVLVESDTTISKPSSPTKTGYTFNYWELNGSEYNFSTLVTNDITLVANYTAKTYTINLEVNGGVDLEHSTISVTYGQTYELVTPQRENFAFLGWYDSSDNLYSGGTWSSVVGSNFTLSAKWGESYAINYSLNGGTNSTNNPTRYFQTDNIELEGTTKTGYVFVGWYDNNEFTGDKITNVLGQTGELTLYAKYECVNYNINYNLDEGTNDVDNKTTYTIETSVTFNAATKIGYNFLGWYMEEDFSGNKVTSISLGTTGDITLYAKYESNSHKLTFDVNGGTSVSTIYFDYGQVVYLPTTTRNGYLFLGWYNGDELFVDGVIEYDESITLVAKWSEIYYISYIENGGIRDQSSPTSYVSEKKYDLSTATRTGYEFAGWYADENFSGDVITTIEIGTTGGLVFYAKWNVIEYSINYHNVETNGLNQTVYTIESDFYFVDGQKDNYIFNGWFTNASLTDSIYKINKGTTGDMDIYASFDTVVYTITFMIDEQNGMYNNQTYTIDSQIIFDDAEKTGYKFLGWYENSDFLGSAVTSIEVGTTGDVTYYAKFVIEEYIITYYVNGQSYSTDTYTIDDFVLLVNLSEDGYEFLGWYENSDFSGNINILINEGTIGNKDFYTSFECIKYELYYFVNGSEDTTNVSYYTVEDEIILSDYVKAGYSFNGWDNGEGIVTMIEKGTTGSITFYGSITIIKYEITFNVTGVDPTQYTVTYTVESNVVLHEYNAFGYSFIGWYDNSNFSGDTYSFISEGTIGNKEFYCKYSLNTYYVQYYIEGSEVFTNPSSYTVLDSFDLSDYTVTANQSFLGWYTSTDYNLWEVISTTKNYAQDFVLYGRVVDGIKDIYLNEYELNDGRLHLIKGSNTSYIDIPEEVNGYKVAVISTEAFANCTELSFISIPSTVTTIEANAFVGCTSLSIVQFQGETQLNFVDVTAFFEIEELRIDFYVEENDFLKALFPNDAIINFYYNDDSSTGDGTN